MSRVFVVLFVNVAFLMLLNANELMVDKSKFQDIKKINKVLQDPVLTIKGAIEKPESYVLKLEAKTPRGSQNITAYLNKRTAELYMGSAYDKDGKPILFPKDKKVVQDGVAFSYGKGSKEIYLITDPECPYCSKFEKAVHGKLSDYTVHVILFPLSFHKKSPAMVEWILRGKNNADRKSRFEKIMLKGSSKYRKVIKNKKKPFAYSKDVKEYIEKSTKASRELNMRGTPALYDANLNPLSQEEILKTTGK
jgi:thiol:disulfide interchange protein DsbC